jgi:UDP-N-acetyl-D-glucosamine dehydrogenase
MVTDTMSAPTSKLLQRSQRPQRARGGGRRRYVGLPLAWRSPRRVTSPSPSTSRRGKVEAINAGRSYIEDVPTSVVEGLVKAKKLSASTDPDVLGAADAIIICVPTPLNKTKDPDNSFILDAADLMVSRMRPQQLFVLESTTFPGFTREVLLPKLTSTGLQLDRDFYLAFSPERVDPGNAKYQTRNTRRSSAGPARPAWNTRWPCTESSSSG